MYRVQSQTEYRVQSTETVRVVVVTAAVEFFTPTYSLGTSSTPRTRSTSMNVWFMSCGILYCCMCCSNPITINSPYSLVNCQPTISCTGSNPARAGTAYRSGYLAPRPYHGAGSEKPTKLRLVLAQLLYVQYDLSSSKTDCLRASSISTTFLRRKNPARFIFVLRARFFNKYRARRAYSRLCVNEFFRRGIKHVRRSQGQGERGHML